MQVLRALAVLTSSSCVAHERSKFMELVKREVDRIQQEMSDRGGASLRFSGGGLTAWRPAEADEIPEVYASKKLSDKVSKFLHNIEKEMDDVDMQIGEKLHLIDLDGDGVVSLLAMLSVSFTWNVISLLVCHPVSSVSHAYSRMVPCLIWRASICQLPST